MRKSIFILCAVALCASSCQESIGKLSERVFNVAETQFKQTDARLGDGMLPRCFQDGKSVDRDLKWWCSGFFPGSCWYVYEWTGDEEMKAIAEKNTHKLDTLLNTRTGHDIGFQTNCSFGNAYRITGDVQYLPFIEKGAERLATRFSPVTGVTLSWEPDLSMDWLNPVIIDNMMNLELLEVASKLFGCDSLDNIARTHARTTMANHFRPDFTSYHVVDYDPETGAVRHKQTRQGYSDESAWGRGQAWAIYGYTMMFRETGDADFLAQAENIADMIIGHLPEDAIPYWDFNDPGIPDVLRDASAGAIMCSAYVDLSTLTKDPAKAKSYKAVAEKQIRTLASSEYLAEPGTNGGFLLKHSVGFLGGGSEVDVPLTYADYYYLEALLKYRNAYGKQPR